MSLATTAEMNSTATEKNQNDENKLNEKREEVAKQETETVIEQPKEEEEEEEPKAIIILGSSNNDSWSNLHSPTDSILSPVSRQLYE